MLKARFGPGRPEYLPLGLGLPTNTNKHGYVEHCTEFGRQLSEQTSMVELHFPPFNARHVELGRPSFDVS